MSHYHGNAKFNFMYSNLNTWINLNNGDDTLPPWQSKVYTHNSDGTLSLDLMVDLRMMTINGSSVGTWSAVKNRITLTDLR